MDLTSLIQPVSILIEVLVCLIGITIAVQKKRTYGWFIAFTFGVYVVYDLLGLSKGPDRSRVPYTAVSRGKPVDLICSMGDLPQGVVSVHASRPMDLPGFGSSAFGRKREFSELKHQKPKPGS